MNTMRTVVHFDAILWFSSLHHELNPPLDTLARNQVVALLKGTGVTVLLSVSRDSKKHCENH